MNYIKLMRQRKEIPAQQHKPCDNDNNNDNIDSCKEIKSVAMGVSTSGSSATEAEDINAFGVLISSEIPRHVILHPIGDVPQMFYCQNALSTSEQEALLHCIHCSTLNGHDWIQLKSRRLQCWGQPAKGQQAHELTDRVLPNWLQSLSSFVIRIGAWILSEPPNQVLINYYDAHEGILHHNDGPAYEDYVVIVSLQSSRLLSFRNNLSSAEIGVKFGGDLFSVLLEPGSVFVFRDLAFSTLLHGISCRCNETPTSDFSLGEEIDTIFQSCNRGVEELNSKAAASALIAPVIVNKPFIKADSLPCQTRTSLTFRRVKIPSSEP